MWVDEPNWQVQSSFLSPVTPPGVEPLVAPLVCVAFNQAWLPYVLGALMQLVQPAAWRGDAATVQTVLDQATGLVESVGAAEICAMPVEFRVTDTCLLQYSTDGGTTWTTVANWTDFAATCFTGPTGPPGPTGPAGGYTPPAPGNPQGATIAQQACNIASYIAADVVVASLNSVISSIMAAENELTAFTTLLGILIGPDPVGDLVLLGVNILYRDIEAGTLAHYSAAVGDATFLSDVQCAIYTAIAADGAVTNANFAAVQANIAAITYTYPEVVTTVSAYVAQLGALGLEQLQIAGSLYVGDCGACGGPWSHEFDFVLSDGGWLVDSSFGTQSPAPVWTSGVGWVGATQGGGYQIDALYRTFTACTITDILALEEFTTNPNAGGAAQQTIGVGVFADGTYHQQLSTTALSANLEYAGTHTGVTRAYIVGTSNQTAGGLIIIKSVTINGTGPEPVW